MRKRPFQRPVALTAFNRGCASVCDWVSVVMNGYPLKAERCRSGTLTQFYCVTNELTASGFGFVIGRSNRYSPVNGSSPRQGHRQLMSYGRDKAAYGHLE